MFHRTKAGTIVGGTLSQGVMREGDKLCVGPSELGEFYPVTVTSIYRNRAPTRVIRAGQAASVALSDVERHQLRRVSNQCFTITDAIFTGFNRFQHTAIIFFILMI